MRTLTGLLVALLALPASGQPTRHADAPHMWRVAGGYMLSDEGYARLAAETERLQLAERALSGRVKTLEASQGVSLDALGAVAGLALVAGVVLGAWAYGAVLAR